MWSQSKSSFLTLMIILVTTISTNFLSLGLAKEINIGRFKSYAHGLKSGSVTLLDCKRIQIRNFHYDGLGPDAWFQIGQRPSNCSTDPKERDDLTGNLKIPDENGSCAIVKKYNGKTITLKLPNDLTFKDVAYVSLYCYKFQHNFGYVKIPTNLAGLNENAAISGSEVCK